ncbi:MAG: hypothetical protein BMS9Abin07_1532 [Acidimicrobiia bacterium]|nr:MAG: hypothetical protein BMS9Abin07_1532 [Acidimicrobiia bacterium]
MQRDPHWAGGRPRQITTDDVEFIVETAKTRPEKLGQPFTRWCIGKLIIYVGANEDRCAADNLGYVELVALADR